MAALLRAAIVALCSMSGAVANEAGAPVPERALAIPVDGIVATDLRDTYATSRPGHVHEAIDIAAPRGTRVFAVDDGTVVKLFSSVPGGLTVYQFDPSGKLAYYYAHLDRYADGLKDGTPVKRCALLGYVGVTGNAPPDAPHLHFAVFVLGPERQWWKGTAINPYPMLVTGTTASCP